MSPREHNSFGTGGAGAESVVFVPRVLPDQGAFPMKSRVFLPALLAAGLVFAAAASQASAFELLNKMMGHRGHGGGCCASTCGCEPSCCPAPCEQTCCPAPACEQTCCPAPSCAPACGCEATCAPAACDSCCDSCNSCCGKKKRVGLLQRLFARHKKSCCAPSCCEPACCAPAPTCGCGH
jgi:hypothetical protein